MTVVGDTGPLIALAKADHLRMMCMGLDRESHETTRKSRKQFRVFRVLS